MVALYGVLVQLRENPQQAEEAADMPAGVSGELGQIANVVDLIDDQEARKAPHVADRRVG